MEQFHNLQVDVSCQIQKQLKNFKKSPKERITDLYVEARLENLEQLWKSFYDMHRKILSEVESEELYASEYYTKCVYDQTEELYIDFKVLLKQKLSSLPCIKQQGSSDGPVKSNVSAKLPKISIPSFDGSYINWTSFRDLFISLIHNNDSLDNIQKLHYLKSHLTGEAEQLLRNISITADNYSVCWTQLVNRYDNKRFLANHTLKRLIGQKTLQTESSSALKELLDTMSECLSALSNLKVDISTWDIIVIFLMSAKLDPESRKQWEAKANEKLDALPTLDDFKSFLEHRFRSLEYLNTSVKPKPVQKVSSCNLANSSNSSNEIGRLCQFCSDSHKLFNCKLFAKENLESRRQFVQSKQLCFNCFGEGHSVFFCKQASRCKICNKKHHSLLHGQMNSKKSTENVESVEKGVAVNATTASTNHNFFNSNSNDVLSCFSTSHCEVLLATALVRSQSRNGSEVTLRCLVDQGSQTSFITESAVQILGLQKVPSKLVISGLGSTKDTTITSNSVVVVRLHSIHDSSSFIEARVHVVDKLTTLLPSRRVEFKMRPEMVNLKLADPRFNVPNKVDVLLGAEVFTQILEDGLIKGNPLAQKTMFGWILSGKVPSVADKNSGLSQCSTVVTLHSCACEGELLQKFWELENEPVSGFGKKILSEEEERCEKIFADTTTRDEEGRYIVKLPFRDDDPRCKYGNSMKIAARRLHLLEKRLDKTPELKQRYADVIKEYEVLNHMELVPVQEINSPHAVYLPHHAVVREERTTTKFRVVFDASCQGTNGVSLNQDLMIGPRLQPDLRHLIMRWRQHPISMVADLVKMYRQVKVTKADADMQRILWRDEEGQLQHYRMLRVTFGTASAPYLAVKALQQLALDETDFPAASVRVLRDFYMDDLMSGCETVEEGIQIYDELKQLMKRGGFEIQKWGSNSKELLERTGEIKQNEEGKLEIETEKDNKVVKVLGLCWNSSTDEFLYSVKLPELSTPVTKRKVISDISRLFDPLGWIAPVIVSAKIMIQKMWICGLNWDQELPSDLLKDWLNFRNELSKINGFCIPRWMHTNRDDCVLELHGFSDASNDAYAGVVYARTVKQNGDVCVNLVTSKTKVSPIKQISIPRLELCGAVLVARLLNEVAEILGVPKDRVHAWTDSTVVLAWISSHPSKWKPFVANRVSEIITLYDRSHWSHVKSQDNPADCASRGIRPSELKDLEIWINGPKWLHNDVISYDDHVNEQDSFDTTLEQRANTHFTTSKIEEDNFFERFSFLRRLVRVFAWCRRFYTRSENRPTWLTANELRASLNLCIKRCQGIFFTGDLAVSKGKFSSLNLYRDNDGFWRVGGRLQNSDMQEDRKHPILIPRDSHLAKLIVADAHHQTLHGGPLLMINYIRSKYWIINLKSLVKFHVHRCVTCLRYSSRTVHPLMGQLPSARVTASRPFRQTGLDYAGPISVRTSKGRGYKSTKGYICLFVCMATRAIHLEAVSDLTSEAFISAFKRFVARRGLCSDLWSDNGTTFVGADRELKVRLTSEKSSVAIEIADWLETNAVTWHRIPPHSPNFGGLWEAGVKSTKHHLKRIIGDSKLTFEELSTMLAQIEACLNSRPISALTESTDDPEWGRVGKSGEEWGRVGKSGEEWGRVGKSGE